MWLGKEQNNGDKWVKACIEPAHCNFHKEGVTFGAMWIVKAEQSALSMQMQWECNSIAMGQAKLVSQVGWWMAAPQFQSRILTTARQERNHWKFWLKATWQSQKCNVVQLTQLDEWENWNLRMLHAVVQTKAQNVAHHTGLEPPVTREFETCHTQEEWKP